MIVSKKAQPAEQPEPENEQVQCAPTDDRPQCCGPRLTIEAWTAAKAQYARLRQDPAHLMQARFRAPAVIAQMASGAPIDPLLALEFADLIRAHGYVYRERHVNAKAAGDPMGLIEWNDAKGVPTAPLPPGIEGWMDELFVGRR